MSPMQNAFCIIPEVLLDSSYRAITRFISPLVRETSVGVAWLSRNFFNDCMDAYNGIDNNLKDSKVLFLLWIHLTGQTNNHYFLSGTSWFEVTHLSICLEIRPTSLK